MFLAIAGIAAPLVSVSGAPSTSASLKQNVMDADPVALLEFRAGNNPDQSSGPVLAIWNDGTVVFAFSDTSAGKSLQVGKVPPERVDAAMTEVAATGIFDCELDWNSSIPDSSHYTLALWNAGKLRINRWNEVMTVPWGVHINTDAAHAKLVKSWTSVRAILALTCPDVYKALDPQGAEAARLTTALESLRRQPAR